MYRLYKHSQESFSRSTPESLRGINLFVNIPLRDGAESKDDFTGFEEDHRAQAKCTDGVGDP